MKLPGYYTSGQFAKMAQISVRTIRFYDQQNILKPSYVNESGARFYSDADFARLEQILLLKYLGFSLEDIRNMTVGDAEHHMLRNSLKLQLKLIQDRIEQLQMVEKAIQDTTEAIDMHQDINWSQMLNLIHLTNMESTLKTQYQNASNISARIRLHKLFTSNREGWFPWIYKQCDIREDMTILELGCGDGSLWKENMNQLPGTIYILLNDISEGMLRDTKRELEQAVSQLTGHLNSSTAISDHPHPSAAISVHPEMGLNHNEPDSPVPQLPKTESQQNNSPFSFEAFDCRSIPCDDTVFDLVIANHVLFYCDDLDCVLGEVRRVLKPGGHFVCSTYGANHMKEITDLVKGFHKQITLSADRLYERFGLENGQSLLAPYFTNIELRRYEDSLLVTQPEPLIEYVLSCHGNQNQYILERYKDFRSYVERKTTQGFHITKDAGLFICSGRRTR